MRRVDLGAIGVCVAAMGLLFVAARTAAQDAGDVVLPGGVEAVWDMEAADREATATRERICINGLWRFQPAGAEEEPVPVPDSGWGYLKVPGPWPSGSDDCQAVFPAPRWAHLLPNLDVVWHERDVTVPADWQGRRIALHLQWINSYARIFVDGHEAGSVVFPGRTHRLALQVTARRLTSDHSRPLPSERGPNQAGGGRNRGLIGDVFLAGTPAGARIDDVRIDTSVREWRLTVTARLAGLQEGGRYALRARVLDGDQEVLAAQSEPFTAGDVQDGRFAFSAPWQAPKLWDTETPENIYRIGVELWDGGRLADACLPVRFGFREFWVDGRDFYLNGVRTGLRALPIAAAQTSPAYACYEGAREIIERYQWLGFNAAYTHNYGCTPGAHLSFDGLLNAADDTGLLLAFSLPHMNAYNWSDDAAARAYERHLEHYVRQAQNHPSVVLYSQNHNSIASSADQNPLALPHGEALESHPRVPVVYEREHILRRFDGTRPVYNHSGPSRQITTVNCYLNWVPMQERAEWFLPWSEEGDRALFLVEYGEPLIFSYSSVRASWADFRNPSLHQHYYTEWGAQQWGDRSFDLSEYEKAWLRWEAGRWRSGQPFLRWDYPMRYPSRGEVGGLYANTLNLREVQAEYIARAWPAFRTLGLSGFNIWHVSESAMLTGDPQPVLLETDWRSLQRPGLSVDRIPVSGGLTTMLAADRGDFELNVRGEALLRYNRPLLAYIGGAPQRFTERGHNFLAGQTVEKQAIVVNDARRPVECACEWTVDLPQPVRGAATLRVQPGENARAPIRFAIPAGVAPGSYEITMTARFDTGEVQDHAFTIDVMPAPQPPVVRSRTALFDPHGRTAQLLTDLGVSFDLVEADADLAGYEVLILGRQALRVEDPAPDLSGVRDGLRVVVFEQEFAALERRLGFRVQEYGLRQAFARVADHPILAGLRNENLHDWHGEATLVPPYVESESPRRDPHILWCGLEVRRPFRAGCYGNVSSVMIHKPARGDFLPLVDGGFGLQYSPLMLYREGRGVVVFCQMDVTGRSQADPAARRLAANILSYVDSYEPRPERRALYAGNADGLRYLQAAGADVAPYDGQPPDAERDVLVVAGTEPVPQADRLRAWVQAGGRLLALGADQAVAESVLPFPIRIENGEHISSYFEPEPAGSLLAGIGGGDLLNRDPRALPLVVDGVRRIGNGVLAEAGDAPVAFCQMLPWQFDYEALPNTKRMFRQSGFVLSRLLGNMGVRLETPLLDRFGSPLVLPPQPPAEYTETVRIEREDRAIRLPRRWRGLPLSSGEAPQGWTDPGFDDTAWRDIAVPGTWEDQSGDLAEFDGTFLYRVRVNVPTEIAAGDALLVLGAIDDEDLTYVNGRLVGSTTQETNPRDYWQAARRYRLPAGTLVAGDNVIAVRVVDLRQSGGIMGFRSIPDVPPLQSLRENRRWLDGLYLDEPDPEDDPYRYFRW